MHVQYVCMYVCTCVCVYTYVCIYLQYIVEIVKGSLEVIVLPYLSLFLLRLVLKMLLELNSFYIQQIDTIQSHVTSGQLCNFFS